MDAMLVRLLQSVGRPVALALVHSLWQGGIIAGLVAAVLVSLKRRSAALRYGVACVGLLAILTASVATAVWCVRHPDPPQSPQVIWQKAVMAGPSTDDSEVGDAAGGPATAAGADAATVGRRLGGEGEEASGLTLPSLPELDMEQAGPWVFSGWAAGVLLLAVVHLSGWARARSLGKNGTRALPREWQGRLDRLFALAGLARSIRVLVSERVTVPTVVGWLRPIVLVPASSFTELTASDLELILIHELAHIRRHDVLINYLQVAVETLLFYHPAVWWLSRRIRIEREHCCDDDAVRATGDGVAYARALSEVEHMRQHIPAHAMAADGGAFRNRIRRLVGVAPSGAGGHRAGLAGVVVITLILGLSVPSMTAATAVEAGVGIPAASSTWKDIDGEWRAEGFGGKIRTHFDLPGWGEFSMTFNDDSLRESSDGGYRLERDAGTFILEGSRIPRKWRQATFRPDPAYAAAMEGMGYDMETSESLLELAVHDVTLDFARGISEAGFDIPLGKLVEFHIHDVTPEYVRAMADAGYDQLTPSKIVEFAIHDIEPAYVKRLAAIGYDQLTPDRLIEFAIHDVDAGYVERMAAIGYDDLTPDRIIEFAIHDVDAEYVERMAATGYDGLTPDRIIEFAIHDVDIELVERLAEVGYEQLTPGRIVEFAIHDIDADYVEQLVAAGYGELPPGRIVEFKIHGVTPSFLRGLDEVGYGYSDMSPSDVVAFAIHDVSPEFIKGLKDRGVVDLSPDELVSYRITGRPVRGHVRHKSSL